MGVDSSNTSIIRQYGTQDNYTLWCLDRSSSGNLILKCKATESNGIVLSVPLNANSNGTNLTQIAYTDDTNYRDEWKIHAIGPYALRVETVFDNAYNNLHQNAQSHVSSQLQSLLEKYLIEFGIVIIYESPYMISSYADSNYNH